MNYQALSRYNLKTTRRNYKIDITIIVPTKNRTIWIERLLTYYQSEKFTGQIIIGDSSNYSEHQLLKELISGFKFLHVSLISCPDMNGEQAVNFCLNSVQTNYVCFCADDDIILTEGLHIGIKFLNKNHEYAGFTGQAKLIGTRNDQPFCQDVTVADYDLYHSEKSKDNRIEEFILNPRALIFSAIRTPLAVKAWGEMMTLNKYHQTYIFGEIIHGICVLNEGKLKKFDFNFCCRHGHASNTYAKLDFYKWLTITEFCDSHQKIFTKLSLAVNNKGDNLQSDFSTTLMRKFYLNLFKNFAIQQEMPINPTVKSRLRIIFKQNSLFNLFLSLKLTLYRNSLNKKISNLSSKKKSLYIYLKIVTSHITSIPRQKQ